METIKEYSGFGVRAYIDGRQVCIGNSKFMNRQGLFYQPVQAIGTAVHVAVDDQYEGYILIADVLRDDVKWTIHWLQRHQLEACLLYTSDAADE